MGTTPPAVNEPFTQEEYLNYVIKNGLLKAKGLDQHEHARDELEAAESPDALQKVLTVMQSAAELRRDLGDIRSLCQSLVLCGHLWLRQCDWPGRRIKSADINERRDRAKAAYLESYDLTKKHGFMWDTVQAAISVAIVYAWREQNYGAAFQFLQEAGQHPVRPRGSTMPAITCGLILSGLCVHSLLALRFQTSRSSKQCGFSILGTHHQKAKGVSLTECGRQRGATRWLATFAWWGTRHPLRRSDTSACH